MRPAIQDALKDDCADMVKGVPQDRLFVTLSRNASDATQYFNIPSGRVIEIGTVAAL